MNAPTLRQSRFARFALLTLACALPTFAQPSLVLSQLQLRYRVLSRSATLDTATAAEVKKLEAAALLARNEGKVGEVLRNLQHAVALLEGKSWTLQAEFAASLALTTDMAVCDPTRPFYAQVRQAYASRPDADTKLTAHVVVNERGPLGAPKTGGKTLAVISPVPPDMVYEPLQFTLDLAGFKSGDYQLEVELRNGDKVVQRLTAPVYLARGLDTMRLDLEQRLQKIQGQDSVKASVRYPFDVARMLNLGQTSIGPAYNFEKAVGEAEKLVVALEAGKNPFAEATGLLERHYLLENAGEIMPYRVYVPKSFDPAKTYPLIIALHGLGGTEVTMLPQAGAPLAKLAEQYGYIVASPMGYRRNGGYGRTPVGMGDPATARMVRLSEEDVMNVLNLMRAQYKIDPQRTYLTGHSMGGNGTWTIGSRHAEIWAAIAPIAGGSSSPDAVPLQKLKDNHVPVMVVHGDADRTAPVEGSRVMVAEMKKLGITHEYIEVQGGTHGDVVAPNFPRIVEFFNQHPKGATPAGQ